MSWTLGMRRRRRRDGFARMLHKLTPTWRAPARIVLTAFFVGIMIGTGLLMLPAATAPGYQTTFVDALFTATSALCVVGLAAVDTAVHWSFLGQVIILCLVQVGGLGIMMLAAVFGLLVSRRVGLRLQITAQTESHGLGLGDFRSLALNVARLSLFFEAVTAVLLTARFWLGYDYTFPQALWFGVFHAVAAFNQAGFALFSDSMMGFAADPWICLPVIVTAIAGALGFPVLVELRRRLRTPRRWNLHTKITVITSGLLLVVGFLLITALEWNNPNTLGPLSPGGKLLAGFFHGTMPRSAGFNSVDVGQMNEATLLGTMVLMFIGGGSVSTAGGIKVTTFALLLFVLVAEARGDSKVNVMGRTIPATTQRQAISVALISLGVVVVGTMVLLTITDFGLPVVMFEVVSAFGVVGLSTGVTPDLPPAGHVLITALMFAGRLGPVTLAAALALRERSLRYELPEERPIVG
ncbi:TrkH family potassium uptake protein [Allonocardiopsis opalescens]|uniref:TrkH family potassium uptake protein n=1 Tax=Allonocardiopsis opalescens TaxID=1144618 RepID=UPI001FECEE77|nr:potassium transporter TrkG [Allonocardiopsis opalescens]